ncbi:LCP family protein [Clostridium thermarum]|uniref:LCP family protein n=1 Tax=Clostridium thermarum TaxID=1716543 RepID=UPI0013D02AEB|nr:LCP family protein [Clostridium thermarum]
MGKLSKKKKIIIAVISALVIIVGGIAGTVYYLAMHQLDKIQYTPLPDKDEDKGIDPDIYNPETEQVFDDYTNIMLIGVDARDPDEDSRSDVMMIATIDKKHNKIKLTSLMRDMIVDMEGHGPMEGQKQDRLNHTYAYGKAALTVKTVNENFKTNIKDFIKVDFFGMEKIIDYVGGVEIDLKQSELSVLNGYIKEVSKIEKDDNPPYIENSGKQLLNGRQAVAYARIRYVGNGDYERTSRQRRVLEAIINKLTKLNPLELNNAIGEMLPYVETSLDKGTIIGLAKDFVTSGMSKVEQLRLPLDDHNEVIYPNGVYFIGWDKEPNLEALHKFMYEEDFNPESLK